MTSITNIDKVKEKMKWSKDERKAWNKGLKEDDVYEYTKEDLEQWAGPEPIRNPLNISSADRSKGEIVKDFEHIADELDDAFERWDKGGDKAK